MGNTNDEPADSVASTSGGFTLSQEPVVDAAPEALPAAVPAAAAPAFEELGELPASYGEDSLFLIARDPHWLFTYWDFDWMKVSLEDGRTPVFHLRVLKTDGTEDATVEIRPEARNWYVPVSRADTEYLAELGYFDSTGAWQSCVRSRPTRTPSSGPAPLELPTKFGVTPEALTFEQLIAVVRDQHASGESFADALGRLATELRTASGGAVIDEAVRAQVLDALRNEQTSGVAEWPRDLGEVGGPSWPRQSFVSEGAFGPSWPPELFGADSGLGASWPPQSLSAEIAFGPSWPPQHAAALASATSAPFGLEVTVRAGVAPDARVTINGRPVGRQPDGSFRLQLQMAEEDWTVPIVVRSADGSEARSGTLTFKSSGSTAVSPLENVPPLPQWTGFA